MSQSHSYLLVHIIFSTHGRQPVLAPDTRHRLFAYLATLCRDLGCTCPAVGGTDDHVHLAVRLTRSVAVADLVRSIKSNSSAWLRSTLPGHRDFAWQRGYGAFSVGPSDLDALVGYIDRQDEHHRTRSFQEEYLAFLHKYRIEFDEDHLWD